MKDYSKLIGYALFVATLIGWGVTIGVYKAKFEDMSENIKELDTMAMEQQKLNGKILMYIEMDTH